ncbi:MAG: sugar ABC transporter permease [Clostridia bacterium]|nr:sugar ABC transporter permease [Clostridia bacterium]
MSTKPSAGLMKRFRRKVLSNWMLYLFVLPTLAYIVIFHYLPLYGIQIAFRNYKPARGIWGSDWVGFKYFIKFFNSYNFYEIVRNTLVISFMEMLMFPMPILLALVLHYTPIAWLRKFTQSVTYAPYFISVVVLCGMVVAFFSQSGIINQISLKLGGQAVDYMNFPKYWRALYVGSGVWRQTGYSAVIYIAALAGVSPELHEAAIVDGANRMQRIWHIDIPGILPTIVILLILRCGRVMSVGFQKAYLLQNDLNLEVSEIISTYVYKMGLQKGQYSLSTAVGLFNNVINFLLVISVNKAANVLTGSGLW